MKIDPTKTNDCNPNLQWVTRHGFGGWELKPCVNNALNALPTGLSPAVPKVNKEQKSIKVDKVKEPATLQTFVDRDLGNPNVYRVPPKRLQSAKLKNTQCVRVFLHASFREAKTEKLREVLSKRLRKNAKEINTLRRKFWQTKQAQKPL